MTEKMGNKTKWGKHRSKEKAMGGRRGSKAKDGI